MSDNTRKRWITGSNAVAVIVLSVGIAIVLNVIASQYPMPIDLTENKIYTLSDASVKAVRDLDEPVVVKAFVSPDMPPPFHNLSQNLNDLLADYAAASGGKLTYQVIQPSSEDVEAEEAAQGYGIQKVGIGSETEDEVSLRAVYKGVAFVKGDSIEVIDDLRTTGNPEFDNFEYDFTKALLNLSNVDSRTLAFVSSLGGPAANPQFVQGVEPVFQQLYGELIKVETVDLSAATTVPDHINGLVILNADQPASDAQKFALDHFVQRGGSLGIFQSATGVDQQIAQQMMQQMGPNARIPDIRTPLNHGLDDLVRHYGIEMRKDLVLDRKNAVTGMILTQQGLARVSYPATFLMTEIDRTLPFMRSISAIAMPAPASLLVTAAARESEEYEAVELIQTSETAVRRPSPPNSLNYQDLVDVKETEEPGPFTVAAALQGKLPSYYESNPLPEGVSESDMVAEVSDRSRVLVVANADFLQPNPQIGFNQQYAGLGGQFFINSLEWLVQDNALTEIRGKSMPRLVGEVPKEQQRRIQYFNILFVPLFFAVFGWTVMQLRKRRKNQLEL